jgi:diadenosine tetraphosphate (Ap4A) HIT family hydrolase
MDDDARTVAVSALTIVDMGRACRLCEPDIGPVVHEARYWLAVVNRNQDLLGKTFLALRRHEELITGLSATEWAELRAEIAWTTERVRQVFAPDHFNYGFLMNADAHVHVHVVPRYVGIRELVGVRFEDVTYPDSYKQSSTTYDLTAPDVVAAVAEALSVARA